MCTTHERIAEVAEHIGADPEKYAGFTFYPGMPYAHKYANMVTDHGMIGAARRAIPQDGFIDAALRGRSIATKDIEGMVTLLVDAEMKMFRELSTPVIFLQNVVVDLLLGLGARDAFAMFAEHVRARYGAEPGFITMNLPMLLDQLDRAGIANPIVCSNINKIGFRMSGGLEAYEEALEHRQFRAVAMSVFASGAIPAEEAIEWVCGQPNIESIVFVFLSAANIRHTKELVDRYWTPASAEPTPFTETTAPRRGGHALPGGPESDVVAVPLERSWPPMVARTGPHRGARQPTTESTSFRPGPRLWHDARTEPPTVASSPPCRRLCGCMH